MSSHHRRFFRSKRMRIVWVLAACLGLAGIVVLFGAYSFLSKHEPLSDADTLVIEAWIPYYAVEAAVKEIETHDYQQIVVVGGNRKHRYFQLGERAEERLRFHVQQAEGTPISADSVVFFGFGFEVDQTFPHIQVSVNGRQVGEVFLGTDTQRFAFATQLNGDTLHTCTLLLDNVVEDPSHGYRLAFLSGLEFEDMTLSPYTEAVMHGFRLGNGAYVENQQHENAAEHTAYFLRELGVDPQRIVILKSPPTSTSNTYQNGKTFAEWVAAHPEQSRRVNLFSQAAHARRSYDMYKKALDGSVEALGVIATRHLLYNKNWWRSPKGWRLMSEQIVKYVGSKLFFNQIAE